MKNLPQHEWYSSFSKHKNAIILDVRTEYEFDEGKIPNAQNIDILNSNEFWDQIKKFDKSNYYFVYCKAGSRSAQACILMQELGFKNTFNLEGGFSEWLGAKEI